MRHCSIRPPYLILLFQSLLLALPAIFSNSLGVYQFSPLLIQRPRPPIIEILIIKTRASQKLSRCFQAYFTLYQDINLSFKKKKKNDEAYLFLAPQTTV